MRTDETRLFPQQQPFLLIFLGGLGIVGAVSTIAAIAVASIIVPDHNWVSETISDLAAGPLEVITDVALYAFAAALVATAIAASHDHLGRIAWSIGVVSLGALAAVVAVIAAHDEYGDNDHVGITIHTELVYATGVLFLAAMLGMSRGAGWHQPRLDGSWRCSERWGVLSPVFFFLPNSIDGLYERGLGLIASAFVISLSWTFLRCGAAGLPYR
ncbi:DUF998 domain-containing protein [Palleronia sp.]|uniref:DUF998 domain-containing protein n=1 Tax=Palleronia sp. TaxID=1940284 RepID=UPI0035C78CD7